MATMPWCTHCDRYLSPSTVHTDGTCPSCGRIVDPGRARAATSTTAALTTGTANSATSTDDEPPEPLPWHFKLLLAALAIYLAYRALQGVEWLIAHL
jgi:predicted RNA-binding Zn-ribbon protein involved in translation (DUF1610 family)